MIENLKVNKGRGFQIIKSLSWEKVLLFIIKGGVFLILLTPLITIPISAFPAIFPKTIYFRILVEIVFSCYLLLLFKNPKYRSQQSLLLIALSVFTAVLSFASLAGINFFRSFWGTITRMEGLIIYLHLWAFFLVLISIFREKEDWKLLLRFFILISIPVAFAGLCQKLGIFNFFIKDDSLTPGLLGPYAFERVNATLGNPIFYGSYLIFVIFFALFVAISAEDKKNRILSFSLVFLNFVMLILTGSRGAWSGVFAAAVFLILIWMFFINKSTAKRIKFLIVIFGILCLFLLFLFLAEKNYLPRPGFLSRYEAIFEVLLSRKTSRFFAWKVGLNALKERPFFGFGPESFNHLYNKYYQTNFLTAVPEDGFFDRAHNKFIDLLAAAGFFGLAGYFFIIGSVIFLVLKYRDRTNPLSAFFIIGLLLAYLVSGIFIFDTLCDLFSFVFLLAFIDRNFRKDENANEAALGKNLFSGQTAKTFSFSKGLISAILIFITVVVIFFANIKPLIASMNLQKGRLLFWDGETEKALGYIDKAFYPYAFSNLEYRLQVLALLNSSKILSSFAENHDRKTVDERSSSALASQRPASLRGESGSADFAPPQSNVAGTFDVPPQSNVAGTFDVPPKEEKIPRALARGASFSPSSETTEEQDLIFEKMPQLADGLEKDFQSKPEISQTQGYLLLADVYANIYLKTKEQKFLEKEEMFLNKIIEFNPQFLKPYRLLGKLRFLQGKEKEGIALFTFVYQKDKNLGLFYDWMGRSFLEAGQEKKGVELIRRGMKLSGFYKKGSFNPEVVAKNSAVYEKIGDYAGLASFYEEVINLCPGKELLPAQIYASLAATYAHLGEKEKMQATIEKLFQQFPNLQNQRENLLRDLEKVEADSKKKSNNFLPD